MITKLKLLTLIPIVCYCSTFFFDAPFAAQEAIEKKEIRAAILDYVEGVYTADTTRIYRSVHPDLVKRGTSRNRDTGIYSPFREMTFKQLVELTRNWNKDGKRADFKSIKEIEIYDVQDKTAAAKLTAVWGTDYFHLAKIDEKWMIMNVLWQSMPTKE